MLKAPTLRNGLLVAGIYIALIGVNTGVQTHYAFEMTYSTADTAKILIFLEILYFSFVIWAAMRLGGLRANGFGKINWGQFLWLVPSLLIAAQMLGQFLLTALTSSALTVGQWALFGAIAVSVAVITFSDEVVFRGILLNAAQKSTTRLKAMLISAASFSLLYAVIAISEPQLTDQLIQPTLMQMGEAFILGLLLAPLALRIGTLWPLIFLHFLWEFLRVVGDYLGVEYVITVAGTEIDLFFINMGLNLVLIAVFWTLEIRSARVPNRPDNW
ncbi:MAG: hypothetical protein CR993_01645 [Rhodobacterales bacterium]|nr:MAG: hypothetical protein CR993_01645 [Rhodobacterales bacterium]